MAGLQRIGPAAGDIGGLLLFVYWTIPARDLAVPTALALMVELATFATVTIAVVGYQLAQGTEPGAWIGWGATAAVGLGFGGSLPLLCGGLALFGVSIVRCHVHPRLPGLLLIAGGATLLVAWAYAPGFGRAYSGLSLVWGTVTGAALVVIAAALADLDVLERQEHRRVTAA